MKPRNAEAARLEGDYMTRLDAALSGRDTADAAEIAQSIKEHVEEAAAEHDGEEVTRVQMANILERLGPPESYAMGDAMISPGVSALSADRSLAERRLDKRRAASWSFFSLLAAAAFVVVSVAADSAAWRSGDGALRFMAFLFAAGAIFASLVSFVMGRLAIQGRALPGEPLVGWPRFQGSLSPVCFGAIGFLVVFLVLPWNSFYLFEWAGMGQDGRLFGQPFAGEDHNLPLFGAGIVYAATSLILALLVRFSTKWLRLVFYPIFDFEPLRPGHWKWLLIPIAIGLAIAGMKLGYFLHARG